MRNSIAAVCFAVVASSGAVASTSMTGTITADNHYALYATFDGVLTFIGANESGVGGAPGSYNWSMAETWDITGASDIYIAAWSDKSYAQGVLASFDIAGTPLLSGDPIWEVIATGINLGDGSPAPVASQVGAFVVAADSNDSWGTPHVGGVNGVAPWGGVAGVAAGARWMWAASTVADADTINGDGNFDEYLIFHARVDQVPAAPTALAFLGGGLVATRRRR